MKNDHNFTKPIASHNRKYLLIVTDHEDQLARLKNETHNAIAAALCAVPVGCAAVYTAYTDQIGIMLFFDALFFIFAMTAVFSAYRAYETSKEIKANRITRNTKQAETESAEKFVSDGCNYYEQTNSCADKFTNQHEFGKRENIEFWHERQPYIPPASEAFKIPDLPERIAETENLTTASILTAAEASRIAERTAELKKQRTAVVSYTLTCAADENGKCNICGFPYIRSICQHLIGEPYTVKRTAAVTDVNLPTTETNENESNS